MCSCPVQLCYVGIVTDSCLVILFNNEKSKYVVTTIFWHKGVIILLWLEHC